MGLPDKQVVPPLGVETKAAPAPVPPAEAATGQAALMAATADMNDPFSLRRIA